MRGPVAIDCTPDSNSGSLLRVLYDAGANAWPDVSLRFDDFLAVAWSVERRADLARCCDTAGLFLAAACLRGIPRALRHFESQYGALLASAVPRHLRDRLPDDFQSAVRERLLVGCPRRSPTLAKYTGRGALGGWLRVMVFRHSISIARRGHRHLVLVQDPSDVGEWGASPEALYLREELRERLQRAVATAIGHLSPRERRLVADAWLGGCSTRTLAAAYDVHHATVARWVQQANRKLFEQVRNVARDALRRDDGNDDVRDLFGEVSLELSG